MPQTSRQYNWQIPQRQSPAAILIMFLGTVVDLLKIFWPALVVYVTRRGTGSSEDYWTLWLTLSLGLISVLITFLKYWFYRFHITQNTLHIQSGWWSIKYLSIPLEKIQSVSLEQNMWQHLFGVYRVLFDATGSEGNEVKIDALAANKALVLHEYISHQVLAQNPEAHTAANVDPAAGRRLYRLSDTELLKLSISGNHIEAFAILFGLAINVLDDLERAFGLDMQGYADNALDEGLLTWAWLIVLVAAISITLSMMRTWAKYYNFGLTETDQGWRVVMGLTTRQQKIVPLDKIQIVKYRANALRRLLDFWIVDWNIIGQDEHKNQSHISLPATTQTQAISLSRRYLPHIEVRQQGQGIMPDYWQRRVLVLVSPLCLLLAGGVYWYVGTVWAVLAGLGAWGYWAGHYYRWWRKYRWYTDEEGLWCYQSVWGERYTLLKWQKIQQVCLSQNVYQTRHQLANVRFVTAGGDVMIPYLPLDTAKRLIDKVIYLVESRYVLW